MTNGDPPTGQRAGPGTPPGVPPATPGAPPETRPATFEDIRGLRRWILVAGIWAAAATAVALIALLDDDSSGADRPDGDAARIARLNRTLDARIDSLEKQLDGLASSDEVTRLGRRVEQAEEQARSAARAAREASQGRSELEDRIQELEDRVEQLESQPASPDEQP